MLVLSVLYALLSFSVFSQNLDQKSPWLSLLPNVSYNANTGVNVGFSLSNISNFHQQKRRNEIEFQRYQLQLIEAAKADSIRTANTHAQIDADLDLLLAELDVLKLHDQLWQIYDGQYQANEISTEEYLRRKIQIQRVKSNYQRKLQRLHLRAIQSRYPAIKILDSLLLLKNFGGLGAAPSTKKALTDVRASLELLPLSVALPHCRFPNIPNYA